MKFISKIVLSVIMTCLLVSCSKEDSSNIFIEIGSQKVELPKGLSVKQLREKVLEIAWVNWNENKQSKTDWCKVYSVSHKNELGMELKENQVFTSSRSTSTFRLIKKDNGQVVAQEQTYERSIRENSSWMSAGNEVHRYTFNSLLKGILNDSMLKCVLKKYNG